MTRARLVLAALMLVVGAVIATATTGAASAHAGRRVEVTMRGNSFRPRTVEIAVGDTVVWINRDIVRHNAVGAERFDTGKLRGGERFAWVAADTGRIEYRCTIHQRMRGEIRVRNTP